MSRQGFWSLFCAAFLTALAVLVTNCQGPSGDPTPPKDTLAPTIDHLQKILDRKKLVALTDNSSTSYFVYRGQPMGYEYDLLTMFCKELDVALEIVVVQDMDSIIHLLNNGHGDVIAANLTITKERAQQVLFTNHHLKTRQVLIQRRKGTDETPLIRDPNDLAGKKVLVRRNSSFYMRLQHLAEEIGQDIEIVGAPGDLETEELIRMVSNGTIDYTIADENVAKLNQLYYSNIDIKTAISFPQRIAWAVRQDAPKLQTAIDDWISKHQNTRPYKAIYTKYFQARTEHSKRVRSEFSSLSGGRISAYDDLLRQYSTELGWDWRLIASMIYEESQFNPEIESWAGAIGLMQIMPITAENFKIENIQDPEQNIKAGTSLLQYLQNHWKKQAIDSLELPKFVLASYNVGLGHVIDARNLAIKHGDQPGVWDDNVAKYLRLKSNPAYYNDPVVKHGYCRGHQPCDYVDHVLQRYAHYRQSIDI